MLNNAISITVQAPELVSAINQLIEAITGKTEPLKTEISAIPVEAAAVSAAAKLQEPETTFEQVHAILISLKQKRGAAAVRGILDKLNCKTVQDIPPEQFAGVIRMAEEALGSSA